jgi:diguanylate cyclase (GGDEF)-like protein/hemerythrin-like metal-binding protein/PAS domain S-box-containing protein
MMSETQSHGYLESAPDGIVVAQTTGVIEYVSRRAVMLFGVEGAEAVVGGSLERFIVSEDYPLVEALLRQHTVGPVEVRLTTADPTVWAEINAERLQGDVVEETVVLILRDVSQRKLVEGELLAAKAAAELAAKRLEHAINGLEKLAATDKLTGLWNRRHFEQLAGVEIARCRRYSHMASLVMVDIDHFKSVNDRFGHDVGDRTLTSVARALREALRGSDSVCRWGGEEFVVLLPAISATGAVRMADRLRAVVEMLDLGPTPGRVTVSAGVAQLGPGEELAKWLKRADEALYRAKALGRNRVELSESPNDSPERRLVQLVWNPEYECGDEEIDDEHRTLFDLANALMDESMDDAPTDRLRQRLSALLTHVVSHFAHEEAMLARIGYEGLDKHAKLHHSLTQEALRLSARLDAGELRPAEVIQFIVISVVHDHLIRSDTLFFPAVANAAKGGPIPT